MKYAKMVIKNDYENKGDLVHREFVRALKKYEINSLISNDNIIIPGIIVDENFCIPFTGDIIESSCYQEISKEEFKLIMDSLSYREQMLLNLIIRKIVFKRQIALDEISDIDDLARDRNIEFQAYSNGLSTINPYDKEMINGYNDFLLKCSESEKVMKKVV